MRLVSAFCSLFLCVAAFADPRFCSTDGVLAESLKKDPTLRKRIDALDAAIGSHMRGRRVLLPQASGSQSFVIPVVVYIVHTNGLLVGVQENITDAQVQSQLAALNQAF